MDASTALNWANEMVDKAKQNYERDRCLAPVAMFMLQEPESGQLGIVIVQIGEAINDDSAKEELARNLRLFQATTQAEAYMFISETWTRRRSRGITVCRPREKTRSSS